MLWDLHSNKFPSKHAPKSVIQAVMGAVQAALRTDAPASCFAWVGPPRDRVKLNKLESAAFAESSFQVLGVGDDSKVLTLRSPAVCVVPCSFARLWLRAQKDSLAPLLCELQAATFSATVSSTMVLFSSDDALLARFQAPPEFAGITIIRIGGGPAPAVLSWKALLDFINGLPTPSVALRVRQWLSLLLELPTLVASDAPVAPDPEDMPAGTPSVVPARLPDMPTATPPIIPARLPDVPTVNRPDMANQTSGSLPSAPLLPAEPAIPRPAPIRGDEVVPVPTPSKRKPAKTSAVAVAPLPVKPNAPGLPCSTCGKMHCFKFYRKDCTRDPCPLCHCPAKTSKVTQAVLIDFIEACGAAGMLASSFSTQWYRATGTYPRLVSAGGAQVKMRELLEDSPAVFVRGSGENMRWVHTSTRMTTTSDEISAFIESCGPDGAWSVQFFVFLLFV